MPEAVVSIPARRELANPRLKGVRFWPVPGFNHYLIFYRPLERRGVEIVRVLHAARDIAALLGESS